MARIRWTPPWAHDRASSLSGGGGAERETKTAAPRACLVCLRTSQ